MENYSMSSDCDKCGEHALDCECERKEREVLSFQTALLSAKIFEVICQNNIKTCPDSLMRVFVLLAKANSWGIEKIKSEVLRAVDYYYYND